MTIKAGEIVFIKTTEEPVYVLAVDETSAAVRRPIQTQNGIKHVEETWALSELETSSESDARLAARYKSRQDLAFGQTGQETPAGRN